MLVGFSGSLVTHVRENLQAGRTCQHHSGFSQNCCPLPFQIRRISGYLTPLALGASVDQGVDFFAGAFIAILGFDYAGIVLRPLGI